MGQIKSDERRYLCVYEHDGQIQVMPREHSHDIHGMIEARPRTFEWRHQDIRANMVYGKKAGFCINYPLPPWELWKFISKWMYPYETVKLDENRTVIRIR